MHVELMWGKCEGEMAGCGGSGASVRVRWLDVEVVGQV